MSYMKQEMLTLRVFNSAVTIVFCFFLLSYYVLLVPCCCVRYDFLIKWSLVRLQLFVGGLMSNVCYMCLFAYSGQKHIWCCVFILFVFVLCDVCSLFSVLSIFYWLFGMIYVLLNKDTCKFNNVYLFILFSLTVH